MYVRSRAAGERVRASLERWLWQRLRLRLNREKSHVARPWSRKSLGDSETWDRAARLRVAPAAVHRLKTHVRQLIARGRGRRLAATVADLSRYFRGWVAYFRLAEVKISFEDLDKWVRRKLRGILWRQWKRPRTRIRELCRRGLDLARARTSALNGRGPWWNAGRATCTPPSPRPSCDGWPRELAGRASPPAALRVNRRMPNGTSGGVGGEDW